MKILAKSDYNNKSPERENIKRVLDYMDWATPTFIDRVADGFRLKWGGHNFLFMYLDEEDKHDRHVSRDKLEKARQEAQKDIDDINEHLNINCFLNRNGHLVVPYYK